MGRLSLGKFIMIGIVVLLFMSIYCVGAIEDCGTNVRTCARCTFVLGQLEYIKSLGPKAIDAFKER